MLGRKVDKQQCGQPGGKAAKKTERWKDCMAGRKIGKERKTGRHADRKNPRAGR